ncbi:pyridoxal 5'-phosphate synthase [Jeotgalibacillus sp. ET6]|uniref:pyridoxine/pyridoxamine 5'-phosphate oxidase n=1 Tax=Jeotgalibacillus sp. ET6 TaxID=3037260 RepID=UPI00241845E2|nr:pyridoxal 5'-phosphate synthase [Jeotgalibacillus sp. ET6]MDG5473104.1 pyridoxal 5'-phosphate synthase [Jeotgalibacillus sp. ET6]
MNHVRHKIQNSKTLLGPFPSFEVQETPYSPYELFLKWFQVALDHDIYEPHAMSLSTVDKEGKPDSRVLILKDVDEKGWYFATSTNSEKGKQLRANSDVSLNFYWSLIGRQIRIRGNAMKMDRETNVKDFLNRGKVARAISLIGKQSSILEKQSDFEEALSDQLSNLENNPVRTCDSWALYKVRANEVEFWQADENRQHVRLKYFLEGDDWIKKLLWA